MLINHQIYLIQWLIIVFTFLTYLTFNTLIYQIILTIIWSMLIQLLCQYYKPNIQIEANFTQEFKKIAITNFIFGYLLYIALTINNNYIGLSIYLVNQILFHMGEMLHVVFYKFEILKWDSFLINHSFAYNLAITFSMSEYFIESFFLNKYYPIFLIIGLIMTSIGHCFRIGAFISAKQSFHHKVQIKKANDHILITSGIYRISRHPSYFGFFIYSLGQQVILFNPISFIAFIPVLYKFFIGRIYYEEYYLLRFFGKQYEEYSQQTPVLIPFMDKFLSQQI